jgi:hypothetical protein
MIVISAEVLKWAIILAASFCAFMIGKNIGARKEDQTIENTINYLIENGFLRWRKTNGEIELIKLDEE